MGLAGKNNQSKYNETVNRGGSIFEAYPKNQTQGNMAIKNRIVWPTKGAYCIKKNTSDTSRTYPKKAENGQMEQNHQRGRTTAYAPPAAAWLPYFRGHTRYGGG